MRCGGKRQGRVLHCPLFGLLLLVLLSSCDSGPTSTVLEGEGAFPADTTQFTCPENLPYASEVVSFAPGDNAGYGQDDMPDVVLGPPASGSSNSASMDVLSLGNGGEIVVGFGERIIVDGPGYDFIVWENVFWVSGNAQQPFAEQGEVSVSHDGDEWHTFPCETNLEEGYDEGCAGWRPRAQFDPCAQVPITPDGVGGDAFDLADLGVSEIRYVRIRDVTDSGEAPSAGFDLDSVGIVHFEP